jgi:hypothetical protein
VQPQASAIAALPRTDKVTALLDKIQIVGHGILPFSPAAMETHLSGITGCVRMCLGQATNRGLYASTGV